MIRALYTAATGMKAQQLYLDNVSNNLANINTTGFKRSQVNFQDLLYEGRRDNFIIFLMDSRAPKLQNEIVFEYLNRRKQ